MLKSQQVRMFWRDSGMNSQAQGIQMISQRYTQYQVLLKGIYLVCKMIYWGHYFVFSMKAFCLGKKASFFFISILLGIFITRRNVRSSCARVRECYYLLHLGFPCKASGLLKQETFPSAVFCGQLQLVGLSKQWHWQIFLSRVSHPFSVRAHDHHWPKNPTFCSSPNFPKGWLLNVEPSESYGPSK